MDDSLRITTTGLTLSAGTTVLSGVAIPNNSNGDPARYIRVMAESNFGFVKLGTAQVSNTLVASIADILVTPNESVILHCRGLTHISAITRSSTSNINVAPIEE